MKAVDCNELYCPTAGDICKAPQCLNWIPANEDGSEGTCRKHGIVMEERLEREKEIEKSTSSE